MANADIPLIGPILNRIIGTRNERFVRKYNQRVDQINALEGQARQFTDAQLRGKLAEFRARHDKGESADDLMPEAMAAAREAMDRAVGIRQVLNPAREFDPGRLPQAARAMYEQVRAAADAMAPAPPTGAYLGCKDPVPGYLQVDIPPALYEAVREVYPESRPPFRARPFDVQLIGSMVLGMGKIAEMKTGEGKTIVAPLACYMAAIQRMRIHVVTVNDYLVQRDRDWTFPYFWALGLTVGAIHPQHMQDEDEKRRMYRCDVVYGTTAEFGFDYLRDNMKRSVEQQVQKRRQFAIIDEVDSILIDEARTPLIISGPAHEHQPQYDLADRLARHLVDKNRPYGDMDEKVRQCQMRIKGLEGDIRQARDRAKIPQLQTELKEAKAELPRLEGERSKHVQYFEVFPERKQAHVTHDGVAEAQRVAGIGSFYVDQNIDMPHLLEQAVRAHAVYQRDRDYVVMNVPDQMTQRPVPSVVIVDISTGRPMIGRQWSDGLHQAVECKEKVPIKEQTQTVATVTIQNFFKMYKRLAGMTGTADTEAQEFHDIYKLDVVSIPTNKAVRRGDFDDLVFLVGKDKWNYIVDEIKQFHDVGRPILVGTTSVEKSEMLGQMLMRKHGIQHEILNAKQHEREAHIVEHAGELGQVMIATNMAGRGTDIKLAKFTREQLLEHWLKRGLAPRTLTVEADEATLREQVYRKIAPAELELNKRDIEGMAFTELELKLLRHWAIKHTLQAPKTIDRASAKQLREYLDHDGRCLLHNLRWFTDIEDMGGLHVIGTERHEARRIDNQLRGRSGRQGDQGSSRFFVSLDDDLMKMFAGDTTMRLLARLGMKEGDAIEHPMLSKSIERAQRKVEERNFQIRKNVLEYDEVMEHQRQTFYGLRQRVLEGRDVKGLLLDYIREAIEDSCATYLEPTYAAKCAAEFAKGALESQITPDRLRGLDEHEMEEAIRNDTKADARSMIDVTLGEFLPAEGEEFAMDFDPQGLVNWAKSRFGVDLDPAELREGGGDERKRVREMLVEAAERRIDEADLSGLSEFLVPHYGAHQLAKWTREKFLLDVTADELIKAQRSETRPPARVIFEKAEELYKRREVEYPVDFMMSYVMAVARQSPQSAGEAMQMLCAWANQRFNCGWTVDKVRTTPPQKIREEIMALSGQFLEAGRLEKEIAAAQAIGNDEALDEHLKQRFGVAVGVTEHMRWLEGEERLNAVRSRVENILRSELLDFERTIVLETLDTAWRDHLYAMDQLRDSISFRAFSQQDPRIEYKREGSHLFRGMLQNVQDKVTDYVFKAKLTPNVAPRPMPRPAPMAAPMDAAGGPPAAGGLAGGGAGGGVGGPAGGRFGGSTIMGPGFAGGMGGGMMPPPPAPRPPVDPASGGNPGMPGGPGGAMA